MTWPTRGELSSEHKEACAFCSDINIPSGRYMMRTATISTIAALCLGNASAAPAADLVAEMPGFNATTNFETYSGMLHVPGPVAGYASLDTALLAMKISRTSVVIPAPRTVTQRSVAASWKMTVSTTSLWTTPSVARLRFEFVSSLHTFCYIAISRSRLECGTHTRPSYLKISVARLLRTPRQSIQKRSHRHREFGLMSAPIRCGITIREFSTVSSSAGSL